MSTDTRRNFTRYVNCDFIIEKRAICMGSAHVNKVNPTKTAHAMCRGGHDKAHRVPPMSWAPPRGGKLDPGNEGEDSDDSDKAAATVERGRGEDGRGKVEP